MSRLSIELNPEQHKKIKTLATLNGISIRNFVLSKIFADEEKEQNIKNGLSAIQDIKPVLSDEAAERLEKELTANRRKINKRFAKTRKLT